VALASSSPAAVKAEPEKLAFLRAWMRTLGPDYLRQARRGGAFLFVNRLILLAGS
jgi:hypothetical protein